MFDTIILRCSQSNCLLKWLYHDPCSDWSICRKQSTYFLFTVCFQEFWTDSINQIRTKMTIEPLSFLLLILLWPANMYRTHKGKQYKLCPFLYVLLAIHQNIRVFFLNASKGILGFKFGTFLAIANHTFMFFVCILVFKGIVNKCTLPC